jgi:Leucine-rich repeat (LRR) protein
LVHLPLTNITLNNCTEITDAALPHVSKWSNLDQLFLSNTQVTDAGIEHLEGLKNLETLDLTGTKFTAEGIEAIKAALPDCEVVWEEGSSDPAE